MVDIFEHRRCMEFHEEPFAMDKKISHCAIKLEIGERE